VDRLACVSIPALPLQILLRHHPEWRGGPVAVLEEDRPQSPIVWVNSHARRAGVRPGMRFSAALAFSPTLNAGCVFPADVAQERDRLIVRLRQFTPDIEPGDDPGVFWVGLTGLDRLYPSPARWAGAVRSDLLQEGFQATVVIGFTRFGTYAVAQITRGVRIFHDAHDERAAAMNVSLAHLTLTQEIRETLTKLNVTTVRALVQLPEAGLLERFGMEAYRLHQAAEEPRAELRSSAEDPPVRARRALDEPETDLTRCLFVFKQMLDPMLATLAARGTALSVLEIRLELDRHGSRTEHIRPAAPTLDSVQILDLVRLRLEGRVVLPRAIALGHPSSDPARTGSRRPRDKSNGLGPLHLSQGPHAVAGITDIELTAEAVPATHEQLRLFGIHPRRDLTAGNRALARLRAEFGEQAVVRARLRDGHLPEARVAWEPVSSLTLPHPDPVPRRMLVRRIWAHPEPLVPAATHLHDGWLILGTTHGAVEELLGPYIVSGGWWVREVDRAYHFAQTRHGDLLWVYHDRLRRRWFLHGRVE